MDADADGERRLVRSRRALRLNSPSTSHLLERALHAADGVVGVGHGRAPEAP